MDIRSLLDSDDAPTARRSAPSPQSITQSPSTRLPQQNIQYGQESNSPRDQQARQSSVHEGQYRSPRQQYGFPQSHQPPQLQYPQQNSRHIINNYSYQSAGPPTPGTHTPTVSTPGSANPYSQYRPPSSHSASTPTSAHQSFSTILRDSPQAASTQHTFQARSPPSQLSPPPHTSLAPPPIPPRAYDPRYDFGPPTYPQHHHITERMSPPRAETYPRPLSRGESTHNIHATSLSTQLHSISPKTRLVHSPCDEGKLNGARRDNDRQSSLPKPYDFHSSPDIANQVEGAAHMPSVQRSTSLGISGLLNHESTSKDAPASEHRLQQISGHAADDSVSNGSRDTQVLKASEIDSVPAGSGNAQSSKSNHLSTLRDGDLNERRPSINSIPAKTDRIEGRNHALPKNGDSGNHAVQNASTFTSESDSKDLSRSPMMSSPQQQPAKKKARLNKVASQTKSEANGVAFIHTRKPSKPPRMPPPIWAQSVRKVPLHHSRSNLTNNAQQANRSPSGNGPNPPQPSRLKSDKGPLGHWEPSILNLIPADEIIKVVSDFLYTQVLVNDSIGVAPAGSPAGRGAVLEIEAKIGRIMDKNTMDRLAIPVMTETVLSRDHPNLRTSFESSMTGNQHEALNKFLNDATLATLTPNPTPQNPHPVPNNRVPIIRPKHTHEVDTFYELSQAGILALPQAVAGLTTRARSGNKTKVRITHDRKTGQEIAKIVKARIADVDVYSPMNQADWRVSVNVEMDFKGHLGDLVEPERRDGMNGGREKDRLSYKHQAYQIDLTQVKPTEMQEGSRIEHELEVEVSSDEVRRQAILLQRGEPNQFSDLISAFVDNVRTLARHVPPGHHPL